MNGAVTHAALAGGSWAASPGNGDCYCYMMLLFWSSVLSFAPLKMHGPEMPILGAMLHVLNVVIEAPHMKSMRTKKKPDLTSR